MNRSFELLKEKLIEWWELGVKSLPNLLIAIAVVFLAVYLSRFVRRIIGSVLERTSDNRAVISLMQNLGHVGVLLLGMFIGLSVLNLDRAATSLLAGAGVLGLVIGFAFQEIASNFFSGILIAFTRPYKLGDIVEIDGRQGEVGEISLRTTSIMTGDGLEIMVPNKDMFTKQVTNYTSTPRRRIDINLGVSYADDLNKAQEVCLTALEGVSNRIPGIPVEFAYTRFNDSSIDFQVGIWIDYPGHNNFNVARHEAILKIKEAFDKNNISIPFPVRTIVMAKPNVSI